MPGTYMVRAFVVENNVTVGSDFLQDVLRDMVTETALTIDTAGQVQNVYQTLTIDGAWKVEDLRIVVIVQNESTKEVMQAGNNLPIGDYVFRFYNLDERVVVDTGVHTFGEFRLFNVGHAADTYDLSFDVAGMPADWSAWLTDGVDTWSSLSVTLNPGESASFNVVMETGTSGGGKAVLNIHSQGNRTDDRDLGFTVITEDTEVLLVDDDGSETFESDYYGPALDAYGCVYAIWDRGSAAVSGGILSNFPIVVWNVGFANPTLDADDRAALSTYLDGGGALFVSGQDIGWELFYASGGNYDPTWYRNYLHATYIADDTNDYTLSGVAGDPITDGLSITISGGDGANNQDYPDDIDPYNGGITIWTYDANRNGGVRADAGNYRVVYFSFGYEAINNAADRATVMANVLDWLDPDLTGVDDIPARALALGQNVPNPFNPKTDIRFSLPASGAVRLAVFDVQGRLVRTLLDGAMPAGDHLVSWNGTDQNGHQAPSGLYFYKLSSDGQTETKKMVMLK